MPVDPDILTCTVCEGGLLTFCDARAWVAYLPGLLRWS